ncbi:hypothetical protein JQX13_41610 [Archangium violaceum]|uniref:hypothetical protein n=1 Tax=Archangium violaceum TaxID=83451 RepID=UPI00193B061F|nr:hypothetical protein [Archangium violaceum]QRK06528.1 hypothetical protein JQX13_41610 [Archangium violaceum]
MYVRLILTVGFLIASGACTHASREVRDAPQARSATWDAYGDEPEEGVRTKGNTVATRIHALIAQGRFAEAEALIAEASAGGLLSQPHATRLLNDIARLNTRLGDIPASLQRAKDFPSQLREYTLYQIEKMLSGKDFSIATQAQLKMAKKLILEAPRLMEKGGDL